MLTEICDLLGYSTRTRTRTIRYEYSTLAFRTRPLCFFGFGSGPATFSEADAVRVQLSEHNPGPTSLALPCLAFSSLGVWLGSCHVDRRLLRYMH